MRKASSTPSFLFDRVGGAAGVCTLRTPLASAKPPGARRRRRLDIANATGVGVRLLYSAASVRDVSHPTPKLGRPAPEPEPEAIKERCGGWRRVSACWGVGARGWSSCCYGGQRGSGQLRLTLMFGLLYSKNRFVGPAHVCASYCTKPNRTHVHGQGRPSTSEQLQTPKGRLQSSFSAL
jgi:hypothetical protein